MVVQKDKTLWAIPPDPAYEQLKRFINEDGTPPRALDESMIDFAKKQPSQWSFEPSMHQGFYGAIKRPNR